MSKTILKYIPIMKKLLVLLFVCASISLMAQNKELTTFYDNGTIKSKYVYEDSQTYIVSNYSALGNLIEVGHFENGKMDGSWTSYNEQGIKTAEAFYSNGVKTGDWKIFDEVGALRYLITYDSNKIVNAKNFDSAGNSVAELHPH
ncbi:MAG: hypothetical protein RLZZ543_776 [Bacteroidota bacterium]|jgi:antitoxin component YwqK of YwqJK toxin-antitoxin module